MGLDMWVYGIKDITKDDIPDKMTEDWYEEHGYNTIIEYDDDNEFDVMFHDLFDYSVIRNVEYTEVDFDKVKKDYGIKPEASISMMCGDGTIGFSHGKYYKEINLSDTKKYEVKIYRKSLIYKSEELAYWRKEYNLQQLIYDNYDGDVYNCGFHKLDDDLIKKINKYLKRNDMNKQGINDPDYDVKMYHEWY